MSRFSIHRGFNPARVPVAKNIKEGKYFVLFPFQSEPHARVLNVQGGEDHVHGVFLQDGVHVVHIPGVSMKCSRCAKIRGTVPNFA